VIKLLTALAVTVFAASPATAKPGSWEIVPVQPGSANLVATTALAADEIWAAGFTIHQKIIDDRPSFSFEPLVQHWDGTAWSATSLDGSGQLEAIAASADEQIWAVGNSGTTGDSLIEHWDGTAWSQQIPDDIPDLDQSLFGVAAISGTDVWAVGSASDPDHTQPVAQHWDGVRWTQAPLPADLGNAALSSVAAAGPTDVWAAGLLAGETTEPLLLHWDGRSWSRVALPSTTSLGLARLNAITVSRGQVWAVGSSTVGGATNRKPLAFRIDKRGAVIDRTPTEQGQLNAVTTMGPDVWAVGYQYDDAAKPHSYALRRGPDGVWRRVTGPEGAGATLFGLTTVPGARTLWTTGAMDGAEPGLPAPLAARFS